MKHDYVVLFGVLSVMQHCLKTTIAAGSPISFWKQRKVICMSFASPSMSPYGVGTQRLCLESDCWFSWQLLQRRATTSPLNTTRATHVYSAV